MHIVVCLKRVPETAEADLKIAATGRELEEEKLTFDVNESDNYALEEALLLKEKFGGQVTLVSLGPDANEEILRMGLAKGADEAVRLTDPAFEESDGYATARILADVIKKLDFDLILTGCIAADDGYTQVGVAIAETLGIPHAALVTGIDIKDTTATVKRELEGGLSEMLAIRLPALLTIQTGINEPRYASLISIRRATGREIRAIGLEGLELTEEKVGQKGSKTSISKLFPPPVGEKAEIFEGPPDQTAGKLSELLKERGIL